MNWNTTSLIILVLVLVLCCGPMLWMMMRGKSGKEDGKQNSPNNKNEP